MLRVDDLHVRYGAISALHGLSLAAKGGELVAVIGANGAGKSTLLKAIAGFVQPSSGEVSFESKSLIQMSPERRVRSGIALVPEGRQIWTELTVEDHLRLGAAARTGKSSVFHTLVTAIYDLFPILADRRHQLGGTLSGGEQQMLAIGRALIAEPRVLLLDEPTLGLAPVICQTISDSLARTRSDDRIVICAEQNVDFALNLADRGYVLELGEVRLEGSSKELADHPEMVSVYLGASTEASSR